MITFERLIEAIAPHLCVQCEREGAVLCRDCLGLLPAPPRCCYRCGRSARSRICLPCQAVIPLGEMYAATVYEGLAKQVVHRLKFERADAAAEPVARAIASRLGRAQYDVVLPLPTANRRVRQRGYDQAVLITRHLALIKGWPCASPLARLGKQRQLGQSRAVRLRQLEGAFAVRTPVAIQHKKILIIDDVLTTGSTIEAAARVLLEAGARRVDAAVFAVAPKAPSSVSLPKSD